MKIRAHMRSWSIVADLVTACLSYEIAVFTFAWFHGYRLSLATASVDWGLLVALAAILGVFIFIGMYKLEIYVSRSMHAVTLFKGTLIALVITAFFDFTFKASVVTESRLALYTAFVMFFVLGSVVRIVLLDKFYRRDVRKRPGMTVVIGLALENSALVKRLKRLHGYDNILTLEPQDRRRNGFDAEPALLEAVAAAEPAPRQVFIDGPSLGHKAIFDLIAAVQARGTEVYVTGQLVGPLDSTRLLFRLFGSPVMRVRRDPRASALLRRVDAGRVVKRAFDLVTSAVVLVVMAPAFAVIAVVIKLSSRGPVFFRQERIGFKGARFKLVKFRTMAVDNDDSVHHEYVRNLIENGTEACVNKDGAEVYKLVDDDRITGVGRFLRKWSIDELPQFWNVLKGDMSVVGPRPAIGYEVAVYKEWHRLRLLVSPGVSGLWQIAGRSRVDFDEMVFQDVMYGYNQSLLTDITICLHTVPAVFTRRGAL